MKKIITLLLTISILFSFALPTIAADEDYGENICLGKKAFADGIYENDHALLGAENAVDGNYATTCAPSAATSTGGKGGFKGFVYVDLGELYIVDRVILQTRTDYNADWARKDISIFLATKDDLSDAVKVAEKSEAGEFKSQLNQKLRTPTQARYVIVAHTNKTSGAQAFGEIEAYGTAMSDMVNGDFTDVSSDIKNAVRLLSTLGVMEGVTPTEFGPDYLISRGEAAKLISDFAKIQPVTEYSGQFADVTADNPYAPYIQAGLDNDFISEDTHYRPDEYIKAYELVKMVLCINGYYISAANSGITDYPAYVLSEARRLNLFDNMGNNGMELINRSDAAILLFNTYITYPFGYNFETERFEKGSETLLEKLYGYKLKRGIVTGNDITQLDGVNATVTHGSIWIDNVEYTDNDRLGLDYIGETVYFLYDENENILALWRDEKNTQSITIYENQIEDADFDIIKVMEGEKIKKYVIEDHPYVMLNDIADANVTVEDLRSVNGHVVIIDNDRDSRFEVVKIYKPEIVLVDSVYVDEDANEISLSDGSGSVVEINSDVVSVKDTLGKNQKLSRIKKGRLLYIYASAGNKTTFIEIQNSAVEGTVTAISGESIKINDKGYELTTYFKNNCLPVSIGKTANFFVDKNGMLIYMKNESTKRYSEVMAVVQRAIVLVDDDINEFFIYDQDKQFRKLRFADKVKVNNVSKSLYDIQSMDRSIFEGKLVIVNILADDSVNSIITEDYVQGDITKASSIALYGTSRAKAGFYNEHKLILSAVEDVPVFTVPIDDTSGRPGTSSEFNDFYNVVDFSSFGRVGSKFYDNDNEEISVYGLNEYNEPKALVIREVFENDTSIYGTITDMYSTGIMIFDNVKIGVNGDDEIYYTLYGYDILTGRQSIQALKCGMEKVVYTYKIRKPAWFEDIGERPIPSLDMFMMIKGPIDPYFLDDITSLEKGDIVRYGNGGYQENSQLELVVKNMEFDSSKCGVVYSAGQSNSSVLSTCRMQYALAEEIKDGHIKFLDDNNSYETISLDNFEGKLIVVEDRVTQAYPVSAAGVYITKGDRLVIYSKDAYHKSIVVYT